MEPIHDSAFVSQMREGLAQDDRRRGPTAERGPRRVRCRRPLHRHGRFEHVLRPRDVHGGGRRHGADPGRAPRVRDVPAVLSNARGRLGHTERGAHVQRRGPGPRSSERNGRALREVPRAGRVGEASGTGAKPSGGRPRHGVPAPDGAQSSGRPGALRFLVREDRRRRPVPCVRRDQRRRRLAHAGHERPRHARAQAANGGVERCVGRDEAEEGRGPRAPRGLDSKPGPKPRPDAEAHARPCLRSGRHRARAPRPLPWTGRDAHERGVGRPRRPDRDDARAPEGDEPPARRPTPPALRAPRRPGARRRPFDHRRVTLGRLRAGGPERPKVLPAVPEGACDVARRAHGGRARPALPRGQRLLDAGLSGR